MGAERSYRSTERRWDQAVKALNARLGSSNWALLPLSQTAGKGPWSKGSACRPFKTKPGYRHSAKTGMHLPWTPLFLSSKWSWSHGERKAICISDVGQVGGLLGGVSCLTSHTHPDARPAFSGRCLSVQTQTLTYIHHYFT